MKSCLFIVASCMLLACGDDTSSGGAGGGNEGGSEQGGAPEGGAPEGGSSEGGGGAAPTDTLTLDIAADEAATVTCATFVGGVWSTAQTDFDTAQDGDVTNMDCALVAVIVDGMPYWITSRTFEGLVDGVSDLRHAFSTAEALITPGSESLELQDIDFEPIFTGTLETVSLSANAVEIRIVE